MEYKIEELIDTKLIKELLSDFHSLTGITTALLRPDGEIIRIKDGSNLTSGWQKICLAFHRENPETAKRCLESDTALANNAIKSDKTSFYKCKNGLVDAAIPIYAEEQHLANLFAGQFFSEPPDRDFFKKQAAQYNFDEKEYLSALDQVPVYSQQKIECGLRFLSRFAKILTDIAVKNLLLKQRVTNLEGLIPICSKCKKIRDDKGLWEQIEAYIEDHSNAMFSHSLCPKCAQEIYGDQKWYKKQNE